MKLPLLASATLAVLAVVPGVLSDVSVCISCVHIMCLIQSTSTTNSLAHILLYLLQKPSIRAVAQPIENFQDAAFNAVSKHVNHEDEENSTSVDQTDMEMIATEVENNRSRNRRSRNRRNRNRRRRRRRSRNRNRRSRRNRSRRRRRSRGMF